MSYFLYEKADPIINSRSIEEYEEERSDDIYMFFLKELIIVDTKKLFGGLFDGTVVADVKIADGTENTEENSIFWNKTRTFLSVKDNDKLNLGENGWLLYRGRPKGFLNVKVTFTLDNETQKTFTNKVNETLQKYKKEGEKNAASKNVLNSILSFIATKTPGLSTIVGLTELIKDIFVITFDSLANQKNKAIGIIDRQLTSDVDYSVGVWPKGYSKENKVYEVTDGDAVKFAYEIRKVSAKDNQNAQ